MAPAFSSSSFIYRLFFLAALFLRPARAEIYVTGTPAIIVAVILVILLIGCCVGGGIFLSRRRKTRQPQIYKPLPLAQDQVPMLAPPASQGPFADAAAVPAGTYAYGQSYPQNTGTYPQNTAYNTGPYSGPPAASHSNVTLSAYSQDTHANVPAPGSNQNPFNPPPGPPPPV